MPEQPAPKIIVDSDWKSQARAEKERLSGPERPPESKPAAPAAPAPAKESKAPDQSPEASERPAGPESIFEELIRMLATQALLYMGAFPDPETGRAVVALDYAKMNIDFLGALEEKTKGNLSETEGSFLTRTLYELRMQYVEVTKAVAKAVQEGRISKSGGGAPGANPAGASPQRS